MPGVCKRKADGVYYTPQPIVQYIVRQTLGPLLGSSRRSLRILDPACGDGAFLTETYRFLRQPAPAKDETGCALSQIFGVDIDGSAIAQARQRLLELSGLSPRSTRRNERSGQDSTTGGSETARRRCVNSQIRCGDSLVGPDAVLEGTGGENDRWAAPPLAWPSVFPTVFRADPPGFDAVIGNPPYVNIRLLTQSRGEVVKRYLRDRFHCAYRAYDLYVLFLEKALELLRPGGRCGMIVPNKIAALDYALPCRRMLVEQTTLHEIVDVSDMRAFPGAGVYPYILIWEKQPALRGHTVRVSRAVHFDELDGDRETTHLPQSGLSPTGGFVLEPSLDVEARVPTRPLGEWAELHSGTTGFAAQKTAQSLAEYDELDVRRGFEFIVSGNIDRYRIRRGDVRYMKRFFRRPVLPHDCGLLSTNKRALFRGPKIVLAGMIRRLEAAWDEGGLSLGVQVYAAARPSDPSYLLGLLNSKLFSYLFRMRFAAKRLAGGFLAINKGQLAQLPVRIIDRQSPSDNIARRRIVTEVRRISKLNKEASCTPSARETTRIQTAIARADRAIDGSVYQLYELSGLEQLNVEQGISS